MLANALPQKIGSQVNNLPKVHTDHTSIRAVPIGVLNHPMVKASMSFMEKLNTIHRESLLSSTYSMTQTEVLLKHFVSQCQNTSPQQCKAAQIILSGWAKMLWQNTNDDTIEKIKSIVNYCLQFPQDHAPLLVIAYRCLNDIAIEQTHPLAPLLNDIVFVLEQQGLISSEPNFTHSIQKPNFTEVSSHWPMKIVQLLSGSILVLSICQMWIDSTWQLLLA